MKNPIWAKDFFKKYDKKHNKCIKYFLTEYGISNTDDVELCIPYPLDENINDYNLICLSMKDILEEYNSYLKSKERNKNERS